MCLDLDPGYVDVQVQAQGVLNELWSSDKESYVALRGTHRHVYRLRYQDLSPDTLALPSTPSYHLTKGKTLEELTLQAMPQAALQPRTSRVDGESCGVELPGCIKCDGFTSRRSRPSWK